MFNWTTAKSDGKIKVNTNELILEQMNKKMFNRTKILNFSILHLHPYKYKWTKKMFNQTKITNFTKFNAHNM